MKLLVIFLIRTTANTEIYTLSLHDALPIWEMAKTEASLPDDRRIDFVSITTPNHMHFPVAKTFIEAGIHVVCDKPMTNTVEERSEEHTSELQSRGHLVCRLRLEKQNINT